MNPTPPTGIPRVADVLTFGETTSPPAQSLLLEVPHGATRASDYESLRADLHGDYPDDLRDFFFVNTDVGAPELAVELARRYVGARPGRSATLIRCLIPRTFVDCNRALAPRPADDGDETASPMTPGLPPYIQDARDIELLSSRHRAYVELVEEIANRTLGSSTASLAPNAATGAAPGGRMLMIHSYAPRSLDVKVDEHIVATLRREYEPGNLERWPLRPEIDLIVDDPDGQPLGDVGLASAVQRELARRNLPCARSATYALHPATVAHSLARRWPGRTLCLEVRRDLLANPFDPFAEMTIDPRQIEDLAVPLSAALEDAEFAND